MDSTFSKDTLAYDQLNRLLSINGGAKGSYYYDGEGKRIRKNYSNSDVIYLYDQWGNVIAETDIFGNLMCEYIWANGKLIAKIYQETFYPESFGEAGVESESPGPPPVFLEYIFYYHLDHLGTPLALTNEFRNICWSADYLPFGEIYNELIAPVSNEIRFPGQYHDRETGLYYNWHRYYKPTVGRYYQSDPVELGGASSFQYVSNNPLAYVDPSGLTWLDNWLDNVGLVMDWVFERGKETRLYGPNTPQTRDIAVTEGARIMREDFVRYGCRSSEWFETYGTFAAFLESLNNPFNATQVQVGRFDYAYLNNGNGTVTYVIFNMLSIYSFFYHFGQPIVGLAGIRYPDWFVEATHKPRGKWFSRMGNLKQIFYWTEPLPEECKCESH